MLPFSCHVMFICTTWLIRFVFEKRHNFSLFSSHFSLPALRSSSSFVWPGFCQKEGTIFWMSRALINGCQQPPCQSGRSLCATEGVCVFVTETETQTERCWLPVCPCSWHLWFQREVFCIDPLVKKSGIWIVSLSKYYWEGRLKRAQHRLLTIE